MCTALRVVGLLASLMFWSGCYSSAQENVAGSGGTGDVDAGVPRPYDYTWLLSLGVDLPPMHDAGHTLPPDAIPTPPTTGWNDSAAIDLGGDHACVLTQDGEIHCWGSNAFGQTGRDAVDQDACGADCGPHRVDAPDGSPWVAVSAGHTHTCALTDNAAYCWGSNGAGELGNGTNTSSYGHATPTPVAVAGSLAFTHIAAGEQHTCGIAGGAMYCWGANGDSELGLERTGETCLYGECARTPRQLGAHTDWDSLAAGGQITCGIRGGSIYCWGASALQQLGLACDGDPACQPHQVARVDDASDWASVSVWASGACAIKGDGRLFCWGADATHANNNPAPTEIALGDDVVGVAPGENHTCAVVQSGALYCWGLDYAGEIGDGPSSPAECDGFGCTDGPVRIGSGYSQVSAGYSFSCATGRDGGVACWGANHYGQLGTRTAETCDPGSGTQEPCATAPIPLPPR